LYCVPAPGTQNLCGSLWLKLNNTFNLCFLRNFAKFFSEIREIVVTKFHEMSRHVAQFCITFRISRIRKIDFRIHPTKDQFKFELYCIFTDIGKPC
jgi:hypothetical protein